MLILPGRVQSAGSQTDNAGESGIVIVMAVDDQLASLRAEYETEGLSRAMLDDDPIVQFGQWMDQAIDAGVEQANAMILSTADVRGRPSSRAVLLKGCDERGFVFFTNLESRKGQELSSNPYASLCFLWLDLHRQVRVTGQITYVSQEESDEYFALRPRQSQLASAASPQSRRVADRATLESLVAALAEETGDGNVVRPPSWGGIRVKPETVEFWQGRLHRLHDRFNYRRSGDGWVIERLAP